MLTRGDFTIPKNTACSYITSITRRPLVQCALHVGHVFLFTHCDSSSPISYHHDDIIRGLIFFNSNPQSFNWLGSNTETFYATYHCLWKEVFVVTWQAFNPRRVLVFLGGCYFFLIFYSSPSALVTPCSGFLIVPCITCLLYTAQLHHENKYSAAVLQ